MINHMTILLAIGSSPCKKICLCDSFVHVLIRLFCMVWYGFWLSFPFPRLSFHSVGNIVCPSQRFFLLQFHFLVLQSVSLCVFRLALNSCLSLPVQGLCTQPFSLSVVLVSYQNSYMPVKYSFSSFFFFGICSLPILLGSLIHLELIFVCSTVRIQFHSFACVYPVFSILVCEKISIAFYRKDSVNFHTTLLLGPHGPGLVTGIHLLGCRKMDRRKCWCQLLWHLKSFLMIM